MPKSLIGHRGGFAKCLLPLLMWLGCAPASLLAGDTGGGWGDWWLPPNHSVHGDAIDSLFTWIFWITMVTFVVVELVLVIFLIKYRDRGDGRRAVFIHGNTRLEMCWTIAPSIILAVLALASKQVWDNYRYAPDSEDPNRAIVLVIGEQFKWNIIYPGPDGKLGAYLKFPHPSDARWQNPDGSGKPFTFQGVTGPSKLAYNDALKACNAYIDQVNKLGKDFEDPEGMDDDWQGALGRVLTLPKGRPIEVQLSSKDVIHDFFLPNFRVKLDAVPGMRGRIFFTSRTSSNDREKATRKAYKLDELPAALKLVENDGLSVAIDDTTPGAQKDRTGWRFADTKAPKTPTIIRNGASVPTDPDRLKTVIEKLRANGVESLSTYVPGDWDLVCEELCGQGHYTMKGTLHIVDSDQYDALKLDKPYRTGPATMPSVAVGTAR